MKIAIVIKKERLGWRSKRRSVSLRNGYSCSPDMILLSELLFSTEHALSMFKIHDKKKINCKDGKRCKTNSHCCYSRCRFNE